MKGLSKLTPKGGRGGDRLGSGHPQKIVQSPDGLNKAPTDYTKPQQTIQRPEKIIQRPNILYETSKNMQDPKMVDKNHTCLARVTTNTNLA